MKMTGMPDAKRKAGLDRKI